MRQNFQKKGKISEKNSFNNSRTNKFKFEWNNYLPPKPKLKSLKVFNSINIEEIIPFFDWKPFFQAWELHGNFPEILKDKTVGVAASELWKDANKMLNDIIKKN